MNKKLFFLIGLALAGIVLSNVLATTVLPLLPKPVKADSPDYLHYTLNAIVYPLINFVLPFAALMPLILFTQRRHSMANIGRGRFIALHFSICFLFSLAQIVIHMFFEPDQGYYFGDALFRLILGEIDYFASNFVFYFCVIAASQALMYLRQLRQKEVNEARLAETLANARLSSLKMKLQPHFIFNALQSINVLMLDKQISPASEMISRLGRLLRHSIDIDDSQMVTVESELDTVQDYLAIEEIRFKDRLHLDKSIDPDVQKAVIPGLILQPLIENAIKHGIAKRIGPGRIQISVQREKSLLKIAVKNDGPGLPPNWNLDEHSGFGLQATKKRLELIYGHDFSFTVQDTGEGGVCSEIVVPFSEEILNCREEGET